MTGNPSTAQWPLTPPETQVRIIVNAGAGTASELELIESLKRYVADKPSWSLSIARTGSELAGLVRDAAASDSQTIVAAGGDGTINTVAAAILNTDKALGIVPVGTLNHFAKDLHIPLSIDEAIETISHGRIIQVDVGQVNDHIFVNNSSLGLYPSIVTERKKQQRLGWGKWPAFIWAAFMVLRRYPLVNVKLTLEGKAMTCRTPFVFVGNNKYLMEGFQVGIRESLDAGILDVYITNRTGRFALLRLAWRALLGRLRNDRDFAVLLTNELSIETRRRRLFVAVDGEVKVVVPPLQYRVLPKALRVIVPQAERESE